MKPRRWFHFSLRTFFVLVALFGFALGWLDIQVKWLRDRRTALNWLVARGDITVTYAPNAVTDNPVRMARSLRVLRHFGFEATDVALVRVRLLGPNDYTLAQLRALFPEADIEERGTPQNP